MSTPALTGYDAELMSVLVALAPLDSRAERYVDLDRREFHADRMLRLGWSSGERDLIHLAKALWTGNTGELDLAHLVLALDGRFFQAAMDAIAVRRGQDIVTDGNAALDRALA
ncbi:MAG: hypothetical protein ACXV3V_11030 [Actinomycetes bacterium]